MEKLIDRFLQELPKFEYDSFKRSEIIEERRLYYIDQEKGIDREDIIRTDQEIRKKVLEGWRECEDIYNFLKDRGRGFYIEERLVPVSDEEHISGWYWLFHDCNENYKPPIIACLGDGDDNEFKRTDLDKLYLDSEGDTYWSSGFPGDLRGSVSVCNIMERLREDCCLSLCDIIRLTGFKTSCKIEII